MSDALRVLVLLPSLAAATLSASEVPLDTHAASDDRSHIAHVNGNAGNGGTATTPAISNTMVKFTGTSYPAQPTIVSPTGRRPQAEEHIAASVNGTLVAAISDFSSPRTGFSGYNSTMYAVSADGISWTASYVPFVTSADGKVRLQTDDGGQWDYNSDPVVAFDSLGNAYIADLYLNNSPSTANGIYLTKLAYDSNSKSLSYAGTTPVVETDGSTYSEDKEWLAIDPLNNTKYVSWTRFTSNSDSIWLASLTTDSTATWSMKQISPAALNGAVQGSQVVVGANHVVYVAWHVAYSGNRGRIWLASSADDFASAAPVTPLFYELTFNSSYRKNSFPALAVSADGSQLHLVYADMPSRYVGAEIEYTTSINGGAFSAPATLNSSASGQQFMPAIAVDTLGGVHVSWFDTRNASSASSYDIYAIHGSPVAGGLSWGANYRVTPKPVSAGNASFIGDYAGICAGPVSGSKASAHPVWTNGGFNNGTLQTTTLVPAN